MTFETITSENHEFNKGIELFNRAAFFDAHEILEDVWRSVPRDHPPRRHLQGMVQLAVAFHHVSRDNYLGASSVLERALRNLTGADRSFPDLDLNRLRADLSLWQSHLNDLSAPPEDEGRVRTKVRTKVRTNVRTKVRPDFPPGNPPLPKIFPRRAITD